MASSEAVAVANVGVSGIPVELVGPAERQEAMDRVKAAFPGLVVVDYTLPTAVNGKGGRGGGERGTNLGGFVSPPLSLP